MVLFLLRATCVLLLATLACCSMDTRCNQTAELTTDEGEVLVYDIPLPRENINDLVTYCSYQLRVPSDHGIKVVVEKFGFQAAECPNATNNCCDYLQIGTGPELGQNITATYCGSGPIETFILNSTELWLTYSIRNYLVFHGATLKFEPVRLVYRESSGLIRTNRYYNNMDLMYKIIAEDNSLLSFKFKNKFGVEEFGEQCIDFVKVGELNGTSLMPVGEGEMFCGESVPAPFTLNTNTAYVRLVTDASERRVGFSLEYTSVRNVFTEPRGLIVSTPLNVTYRIIAPKNKRIELDVESFTFEPCQVAELSQLVVAKNRACLLNDHLTISNQQGSIDSEFYDSIKKMEQTLLGDKEWTFCECNKPVRKYLSLSNELSITNTLRNMDESGSSTRSKKKASSFRISYKFVDAEEYRPIGQVRVVQDALKSSMVNGYLLRVKVPANNHLRIFGTSRKCEIPSNSLLLKKSSEKRLQRQLRTVPNELGEHNCSFLFDISEIKSSPASATWSAEWYLNFPNPFDAYDIELNWQYMKNKLVDAKKASTIQLPFQHGFNLSEELEFDFESTNLARKYLLTFNSSLATGSVSEGVAKSYVKLSSAKADEKLLPQAVLERKSVLRLDESSSKLRVKRNNEWSMSIDYELELSVADCDFDSSFCRYQDQLLASKSSSPFNLEAEYSLRQVAKYDTVNAYNIASLDQQVKDFYLQVSMSTPEQEKVVSVISPLLAVQTEAKPYNNRMMSVSFSYMLETASTDFIHLFLVKNRSDVRPAIRPHYNFDDLDLGLFGWSGDETVSVPVLNLNECQAESFVGQFDPTLTMRRVWRRVEKFPMFSCVNYNLYFAITFNATKNKENTTAQAKTTISTAGLDDIEISYGKELTECSSKDHCSDHGACFLLNDIMPVCCCHPGYKGENCSTLVSACELTTRNGNESICLNGGKCTDTTDRFDYACTCEPGYTGDHCETEINECESNPCRNNARCFDRVGMYQCACPTGFSGKNCELKSAGCAEKCSSNGTLECFEDRKDVVCKCLPGYTGDECSKRVEINECTSMPCTANAHCIDLVDGFQCLCPPHRTGKYCEKKLDFCETHGHLCQNGSICSYASQDGSKLNCTCALGFVGKFCNETVSTSACKPNPCNNGTCIELPLGYKCDCPKGMVGRNCDVKPKTPCYKNKCVHGVCLETSSSSYICSCYEQYGGEFCEIEQCNQEKYLNEYCVRSNTLHVVKDTAIEDKNRCLCICKSGYSGSKCEIKIDLCEVLDHAEHYGPHCLNNGQCVQDEHTNMLRCQCQEGYSGDRCQVGVNYCASSPCKYGSCKSIPDERTYSCSCTRGWGGANCDKQVEVCDVNVDCEASNTISALYSYSKNKCVCMCKFGFDGDRCEIDYDDCLSHECENNAECVDGVGTYTCKCAEGFFGPLCEKRSTGCDTNPCYNGTCETTGVGFTCVCDKGFTGDFCEQMVNKCEPNPCENGATCHNLIDDYHCACPPEFDNSRNCTERLVDPCLASPCLNGASCLSLASRSRRLKDKIAFSNYTCTCTPGFRGDLCDQPVDVCSSNPCKNHGRCLISKENPSEYKCGCFPAFTGKNCETLYDACETLPCSNGGTCLFTPEGFKCQCPHGYSGEKCEDQVDHCKVMKCLNGGVCVLGPSSIPFCECKNKRFTGTQCEIDLTDFVNMYAPAHDSQMMSELKAAALENENIGPVNCNVLGSEVFFINYVFFFLFILFVVIVIVAGIYIYVHFGIKRAKNYYEQVNYESEIIHEISGVDNRFN